MTLIPKVEVFFNTLSDLTVSAESAAEKMEGPRVLSSVLSTFQTGIARMTPEQVSSLFSSVDPAFLDAWQQVTHSIDQAQSYLGKLAGIDRTDGDSLARKLQGALAAEVIEDDEDITAVSNLLTRWQATAPTTTTRAPRTSNGQPTRTAKLADQGFGLKVTCDKCQWSTIDRTDLNSARSSAMKHLAAKHSMPKPGKGDALWQGMTEAGTAVIGGTLHAQGGGFVIDRVA